MVGVPRADVTSSSHLPLCMGKAAWQLWVGPKSSERCAVSRLGRRAAGGWRLGDSEPGRRIGHGPVLARRGHCPDRSLFVRLGEDVDVKPIVFVVGMKWVEVTQTLGDE